MFAILKDRLSLLVLAVAIAVYIFVQFNTRLWTMENKIIAWDAISYYAYLPATFIYGDVSLQFTDNYSGTHQFTFWPSTAPNGNYIIKTTMGLSFLYSPFFALGHLHALAGDYDAGGFSKPYRFWLMFSSMFYLIIGMLYLRRILQTFVNENIIALVFALILFATNLQHYASVEPTMPHVFNFALIAAFMYYTLQWHQSPHYKYILALGLLSGLISLIRPTNSIIGLFFILYNVGDAKTLRNKLVLMAKNWHQLVLLLVLAVAVWLPQLLYWKMQSGQWFFFSYSDERFFFSDPQIIKGLFGYRKGWLLYTPAMLMAVAGFVPLFRQGWVFWPILTVFVLHVYIIFSWWSWWYGGGYGSRPMIDVYPLLAIPLALLLHQFGSKPKIRLTKYALVAVFVFHGVFQTAQYHYGAIHWDSMTREAYHDSFGRLKPSPRFINLLNEPDYQAAKAGKR